MQIQYLTYPEISPVKWDKCINASFNGIIYAYSWYLNIVNDDWTALVLDDYDAVMPLPAKNKFGINYLLQPAFCQQLGIFSTKRLNNELIEAFLKKIPKKFLYFRINLNIFNKIKVPKNIKYQEFPTYQLDLINNYQNLYKSYSQNTKRNIKKAVKEGITVLNAVTVNEFINFTQTNLSPKIKNYRQEHFATLRMLTSVLLRYKAGEIYGAFSKRNELCAVAFFASAHNKTIYLSGTSNDEGYKSKAMFLIVDTFIKKNSEHNTTLDFEGSRIEGIARFYKGFGAIKSLYPVITRNNFAFIFNFYRKIQNLLT